MKSEIKKYRKLLEMQENKNEYEKSRGFSGEKKLFYKSEDTDDFFELEGN